MDKYMKAGLKRESTLGLGNISGLIALNMKENFKAEKKMVREYIK
jgi:hypothetical protein